MTASTESRLECTGGPLWLLTSASGVGRDPPWTQASTCPVRSCRDGC